MDKKDLYTVSEAMKMLGGISRNTLYGLLREGKLASVPIGRRRFIPSRAIDEFIATTMTTDSPSLVGPPSKQAVQMPLKWAPVRAPRSR